MNGAANNRFAKPATKFMLCTNTSGTLITAAHADLPKTRSAYKFASGTPAK